MAAVQAREWRTLPSRPTLGRPSLDYTQTAELDGQFFFSGTPWEMVGRNYTAQTLNLANGGNLTQYDVKSELRQCPGNCWHAAHEGCAACPRRRCSSWHSWGHPCTQDSARLQHARYLRITQMM